MLSLTTRDNSGKAELLFDSDDDGKAFTVLIGDTQYDFDVTNAEWENLKAFLESAKNTEPEDEKNGF